MGRACTVCTNRNRTAIDGALAAGASYRVVAHRFNAKPDSVYRHSVRHLPIQLVLAKERLRERSYSALLDQARCIRADVRRVMGQAEMMFKFDEARACLKEERRLFDVMARNLPGRFKPSHAELEQLALDDEGLTGQSAAMEAKQREVAQHLARTRKLLDGINSRLHQR